MARPKKTGIDYFPFDVDFFSDKKIRILKSRFGADGITIYIYLLCEIYKNGYYIKMDEDYEYIIGDDLGMSIEKVKQVMKFLLERSLLQESTLLLPDTVITSQGIQRRFQEAVRSRAVKTSVEVDQRIWLLDSVETQPFIKFAPNEGYSKNNDSFSENNGNFSEEKCNKVKESKVKKKKEEIYPYEDIIAYLNSKAGTHYRHTSEDSRKHIRARFVDGYTVEDFRTVIDKKVAEWKGTERERYLRPATLFGTKFESYLNQRIVSGGGAKPTGFSNFQQRHYDMDELERRILEAQK